MFALFAGAAAAPNWNGAADPSLTSNELDPVLTGAALPKAGTLFVPLMLPKIPVVGAAVLADPKGLWLLLLVFPNNEGALSAGFAAAAAPNGLPVMPPLEPKEGTAAEAAPKLGVPVLPSPPNRGVGALAASVAELAAAAGLAKGLEVAELLFVAWPPKANVDVEDVEPKTLGSSF